MVSVTLRGGDEVAADSPDSACSQPDDDLLSLRSDQGSRPASFVNVVGWAVVLVVVGLYFAEVGRVTWSDAHNPRSVATVGHQRCWASGGDDPQELCDLRVSYDIEGRRIQTSMKAVPAADITKSKTLDVRVNPDIPTDASPSNEVSSDLAFVFWGIAAPFISLGLWLTWRAWLKRPGQGRPPKGPSTVRFS